MKQGRFNWRVDQPPWIDGYRFYASYHDEGGGHALQLISEVQPLDDHATLPPTLELPPGEAQSLMNAMWEAGLRPRNGAGTLAQVEATALHLRDMRKLVSSKFGVDL